METVSLLGIGLYTLADASRLLSVPPQTLRRWAEGYTFRAGDSVHISAPLLHRRSDSVHEQRLLTFYDLIELKFVAMFRQQGVSLATIRAAAMVAMSQFGTEHPLAMKQFQTDGSRIFCSLEEDAPEGVSRGRLMLELARSQMVIEDIARPFFRQLEFSGDDLLRLRPLGPGTGVVLDPHRAFGKPIDEKSGVPTQVLYQMARGGESKARIAWWYGIEEKAVSEAIQFEGMLDKAA